MKNGIVGAVVGAAVLVAAAAVFVPHAAGQAPGREPATLYTLMRPGATSIGITVRDLSSDESAQAGLSQPGGVRIERVQENTPAADAGLQPGDVVAEFDGVRVRSAREFARLVEETPTGRTVTASVVRGDERLSIAVTPQAGRTVRPTALTLGQNVARGLQSFSRTLTFNAPRALVVTTPGRLGAALMPLDGQLADYFGVSGGVLVSSVAAGTPAADAGLRAGDVITAAGNRRVAAVGDVSRAVRESPAGSSLQLEVTRDRENTTLSVTMR